MKRRLKRRVIFIFLLLFFPVDSFSFNKEELIERSLDKWEKILERREKRIDQFLDLWEKRLEEKIKLVKLEVPRKRKIKKEKIRVLYLTEELWKVSPKPEIEIEIGKSLIFEGRGISRYLVEKEKILQVERVDVDRIKIFAKNIGPTFFHLWDEKGRWTFRVKVIPPKIAVARKRKEVIWEAEPFKFSYETEWYSYYKNPEKATLDFSDLERESLTFYQWLGLEGPTPYGDFDTSLRIAKHGKSHKLTNYSVGLTEGRIGNFKDFNLRIFDFYESFSKFSFPGESLRGVSLESPAFSDRVKYTFIWGREREAYYGYIAPGIVGERKSYVEGVRLNLFSQKNTRYSFNYLKGYGPDREDYLPERVYSFDGSWRGENKEFNWEIAFDENSFAGYLENIFNFKNLRLNVNFRNVEADFSTIIGRPADRGEIGMNIDVDWDIKENLNFSSNLDIYRARYLYNEGKPKKLNYNWDVDVSFDIDETTRLDTTFSYFNEPGISFPRRYLNLQGVYSKRIKFIGRDLTASLGGGFSRSRNPLSPSSDYDTYRSFLNLSFPLTSNLSSYLSYEYNWLREKFSGERGHPFVFEAGLDWRKSFSKLNLEATLSYRDEENAHFVHSFLAGEDSIEGSLSLEFNPYEEMQIFVEARARQVWAQLAEDKDYSEAHLRWGIKSSWDTFFSWNPKGFIEGVVFKDINGDGKRQDNEPGLAGVKIEVGRRKMTTDEKGYFQTKVRAKKILVKIDEKSLPEGYVLTTPSSYEVEVVEGKKSFVNFGVSAFSMVYGVVFYDVNSNYKFDPQDIPLPYVGLLLEDKKAFTNLEGSYYFRNLKEGRYKLKLDINTLPLEYVPSVPLEKEIRLCEGVKYFYAFPVKRKSP